MILTANDGANHHVFAGLRRRRQRKLLNAGLEQQIPTGNSGAVFGAQQGEAMNGTVPIPRLSPPAVIRSRIARQPSRKSPEYSLRRFCTGCLCRPALLSVSLRLEARSRSKLMRRHAASPTPHRNLQLRTIGPRPLLLCHVIEDQTHILIGDHGPHPHVAHNRGHHAGWKLVRRGMATATVGMVALLAFHPHGVRVIVACY